MNPTPSGSASTPLLFIVSFVSVSVLVFFTVTRPACSGKSKADQGQTAGGPPTASPKKSPGAPRTEPRGDGDKGDGDKGDGDKGDGDKGDGDKKGEVDSGTRKEEPKTVGPVSPPPAVNGLGSRYPAGSPGAVATAVVGFLRTGDFEALKDTLGSEVLTEEKAGQIEEIFAEIGVKISSDEPISQFANVLRNPRWSINLDRRTPEGFPNRILLDFEKGEPGKGKAIWKVAKLWIPPASAFARLGANAGSPDAASEEEGFPASLKGADAITVADAFVQSVATQRFKLAKRLSTDPNLNFEQIAALCIVFEEGEFEQVKEDAPLQQTAEVDSKAWVMSKLKAKRIGGTTEFGLEMARNNDGEWTVSSVLLDPLLDTYARAGGGATEDTFYAPIVKNPKGGQSLPVFFKYGSGELVTRGSRQVEVIGKILLADPERKLKISGYADSTGSEDYNFRLSATRAYAVRAKLVEMGVAAERVDVKAFGETKPLSSEVRDDGTDNKVGRAENRRTEILLDF